MPSTAQQFIPDSLNGIVYRNQGIIAQVLDGNIETNFRNHGELSRWSDLPWSYRWNRGSSFGGYVERLIVKE